MTVPLSIEVNITEVLAQDTILHNDSENDTVGRHKQASEVGGSHRWLLINGPAIGSTRPIC